MTRKSKNNDEEVIWLGVVALRTSVCKEKNRDPIKNTKWVKKLDKMCGFREQ